MPLRRKASSTDEAIMTGMPLLTRDVCAMAMSDQCPTVMITFPAHEESAKQISGRISGVSYCFDIAGQEGADLALVDFNKSSFLFRHAPFLVIAFPRSSVKLEEDFGHGNGIWSKASPTNNLRYSN